MIGLLFLVLSIDAQAARSRPVSESGRPTEFQVFGAVLDVDKINSAKQNLTLHCYTMLCRQDSFWT